MTDAPLVEFLRARARTSSSSSPASSSRRRARTRPGDERAVAALVAAKLRELGVDARRDGSARREERPNLLAHVGRLGRPHADPRAATSTRSRRAISREWERDPYGAVVEDGELHGVGSGDMKGAVAAMVFAAAALEERRPRVGRASRSCSTADEEAGSRSAASGSPSRAASPPTRRCSASRAAIVREWEAIDTVSRGAALFKVRVRGTQMHSSISDRLPSVNATVQMARLIDRMDRELLGRAHCAGQPLGASAPTVNVGVTAQRRRLLRRLSRARPSSPATSARCPA